MLKFENLVAEDAMLDITEFEWDSSKKVKPLLVVSVDEGGHSTKHKFMYSESYTPKGSTS